MARGRGGATTHPAGPSTVPVPPSTGRRRFILAAGWLAACAGRPAPEPARPPPGPIAVVSPAVAATPAAPATLPVMLAFGSLGRFLDAALEAERDRGLAAALRRAGYRAADRWRGHLMMALAQAGYRPLEVTVARLDLAFLARPPAVAAVVLDTVVPAYGFVATVPEGPYVPFAVVEARLTDRDGRRLFEDRLVLNAARPFDAAPVPGPAEPRFAAPTFAEEPERAAEGVDAALAMLAAALVARLQGRPPAAVSAPAPATASGRR